MAPDARAGAPDRLLVIEDSPAYAALVQAMLTEALGADITVLQRPSVAEARALLATSPVDCVLLDLSLPDAGGLDALAEIQLADPSVPVVVLTGSDDPTLAVKAVQAGAQDFLVKRGADRELLARAVRYAVERKRAEAKLAEQALRDSLTGLPNRALLLDRLSVAMGRAARRPDSLAVLFIDLDRFKRVNDSLGHQAGDDLLVELANRLRITMRPGDTIARFGGDEFVILCEDLRGERDAVRVAERARSTIAEPMVVRGRELSVLASVGIAVDRWDATSETLIREADAAMYRAKRKRAGVEMFAPEMHAEAIAELEVEHELRLGLERGELRLHYQPEVLLGTGGRMFGAEALVRWEHPRRGLLSPGEFIALAEETGLIVPIGEWVIAEACRQLAAWRHDGVVAEDFTVSVNVSARQLSGEGLPERIATTLGELRLDPSRLCLEVTESCMLEQNSRANQVLAKIKGLGVRLALDDFGTGYSSLGALSSYPVDLVKVDRSFVQRVEADPHASQMFEAVVGVVRAAGLNVIAEGIERPAQLALLRRVGCFGAQGFLFAEPSAATRVPSLLAAGALA